MKENKDPITTKAKDMKDRENFFIGHRNGVDVITATAVAAVERRKFQEVEAKHLAFPDKETILPRRATSGSAGYDFISKEHVVLKPGDSHIFTTDVRAYMPANEFLMIAPRGGFGFGGHHIVLTNTIGIIDSDFYGSEEGGGNIKINLLNAGNKEREFRVGDAIAQGIFIPYLKTSDDTADGIRTGGFHSTGR